jgi:hypothetical protein
VIRVVLAVALATRLLGASLPVAERAERGRNAHLATGELQRVADRAGSLAADNDPVGAGSTPARTTVTLESPDPSVTDGGRLVVGNGTLTWQPDHGSNETVESPVPIRVSSPIRVVERLRVRLTYLRVDGAPVVRAAPAPPPATESEHPPRVETGCRGQGEP